VLCGICGVLHAAARNTWQRQCGWQGQTETEMKERKQLKEQKRKHQDMKMPNTYLHAKLHNIETASPARNASHNMRHQGICCACSWQLDHESPMNGP